jgi:hypothetical protein
MLFACEDYRVQRWAAGRPREARRLSDEAAPECGYAILLRVSHQNAEKPLLVRRRRKLAAFPTPNCAPTGSEQLGKLPL